jgi:hypothetical protein
VRIDAPLGRTLRELLAGVDAVLSARRGIAW